MDETRTPTVLLIDDDPDILKLMAYVFEDAGLTLVSLRDPEAGFQHLARHPVDCVVLDISVRRVPECLAFLSAAAALPPWRQAPVVATSALVTADVREQVLRSGARRFLPKPFFPGQLLDEIRAAVADGPLHRPADPAALRAANDRHP